MSRKMVHVHTGEGAWVGQFIDHDAATHWINHRVKPEMFSIDTVRRDGAEVIKGVFVSKTIVKNVKAADPEDGFLPNPEPDHSHADVKRGLEASKPIRKASKKAGKASKRTASDDDVLAAAVAESLATDKTDDNTREIEELGL